MRGFAGALRLLFMLNPGTSWQKTM